MANLLNRIGASQAIADLLKADTAVLYGAGKLLKQITADPVDFARSSISNNAPYKMLIWAESGDTVEERSNNQFDLYTLGVKIIGKKAKLITAIIDIDKIWEQSKRLMRANMASGDMLDTYYTDPNAKVYSFGPVGSSFSMPEENDTGEFVSILEAGIDVNINRY